MIEKEIDFDLMVDIVEDKGIIKKFADYVSDLLE